MFDIENRRYIGSKASLSQWIFESIPKQFLGGTFFDVFAGTGVVAMGATSHFRTLILNDLLYSNEVVYRAFFGTESLDEQKLGDFLHLGNFDSKEENFFSQNFGGNFFEPNDARQIGFLREKIDFLFPERSSRTRAVALASLLYSADRCANTVGHYEAFLKGAGRKKFTLELVKVVNFPADIHREDSNELVRKVVADVAYLDPPYNSRQYSRFYHVLETLVKWDKPTLSGVALKPPVENSSRYCKSEAPDALADLVQNLDARLILVSYNNTYNSKSSSSRNKIQLDEIAAICEAKGNLRIMQREHKHFNAGKTNFTDHVEYLFQVETRSRG